MPMLCLCRRPRCNQQVVDSEVRVYQGYVWQGSYLNRLCPIEIGTDPVACLRSLLMWGAYLQVDQVLQCGGGAASCSVAAVPLVWSLSQCGGSAASCSAEPQQIQVMPRCSSLLQASALTTPPVVQTIEIRIASLRQRLRCKCKSKRCFNGATSE